jgi:hypothetical protein
MTISNKFAKVLRNWSETFMRRSTHDELFARKGFYYDPYMSQFRKVEPTEEPGTDGREPPKVPLPQS